MAAGSLCVYTRTVWNGGKFSVAVYFGRKEADVCKWNGIVIFVQAALHNIAPAFAELYRFTLGLTQSVKWKKRLFFFGFCNCNRRLVAFEGVFYFFCRNFNISFSAGRTSAAKN